MAFIDGDITEIFHFTPNRIDCELRSKDVLNVSLPCQTRESNFVKLVSVCSDYILLICEINVNYSAEATLLESSINHLPSLCYMKNKVLNTFTIVELLDRHSIKTHDSV